jgi:DNA-binding transcriptional regulator GbsR (MarR family)
MKGHLVAEDAVARKQSEKRAPLARWEAIAIDAVGNVIEFWGFKRNQGRVWAFLYLRGEAFSAATIEKQLELSKGGVSMLLRDLERWGVVRRVRAPGESAWRYQAETEFVKMVTRVIEERESQFIGRVRADLAEARRLAGEAGEVVSDQLARLEKMAALADHTERALKLFLRTARLDANAMFGIFKEGLEEALRRRG